MQTAAALDIRDVLETASPDATAVSDANGAWSYRELIERSRRCAGWLRSEGVRRNDRVLIRAESRREVVALLYGCALTGATVIPVPPDVTDFQLQHIVSDADPHLVVIDAMANGCDETSSYAPPPPADISYLLYTSGSTGKPKAVVCTAKAVSWLNGAIQRQIPYRSHDIVLCPIPLSFDYGLYQVFQCAIAGSHLALRAPGNVIRLFADIERSRATVVPIVAAQAALLVRLARRYAAATTVRLVTSTGEHLYPATVRGLMSMFPAAQLYDIYGVTECKRISGRDVHDPTTPPASVGRPLEGVEVAIVDGEGNSLPPGAVGEIVVRGPNVMAGYWNRAGKSCDAFRRDRAGQVRLHTGDDGHLDEEGYLYVAGRRDGVFKRHGVRTSTAEVERAATDIPGVAQAVVVRLRHGRDTVVCFTGQAESEEVVTGLRLRLGTDKAPTSCRHWDTFPLNANGKIDRPKIAAITEGTDD